MKRSVLLASAVLLALSSSAVVQAVRAQPAPAAAAAAPIPARDYLALATKSVQFLDESSRIAFDKATDPRLRRFARAEVTEQTQLAQNLGIGGPTGVAGAPGTATPPLGGALAGAAVGAIFGGPIGAAIGAGVGATSGTIIGAGLRERVTTDAQKAATLAQLQRLPPGPAFDSAYLDAQITGHQEALAVHGYYSEDGDDPALRRVARRAVPLIRQHSAQLNRIAR